MRVFPRNPRDADLDTVVGIGRLIDLNREFALWEAMGWIPRAPVRAASAREFLAPEWRAAGVQS